MIEIKQDLKTRNALSFKQKIEEPIKTFLEAWIQLKYPSLLSEKEDILFGTFRRLKNKLVELDSVNHFELTKHLIDFTEIECQSTIPNEINRKKNLGLDKNQFKKLLTDLQNGDETLIEKVYLSHFDKCIAFLILNKKCTKEIAYDCSIDALVEIRRDLINNKIKYGNLGSYFTNKAVHKFYKKKAKR